MQAAHDTSLQIGDLAYVEFVASGLGNNVRSGHGTQHPVLCSVPAGGVVEIMGGPLAAEGMTWWKVFVRFGCDEKKDVTGWTSEGSAHERWLRPLRPRRVVEEGCRDAPNTRLSIGARAYVRDPAGGNAGNRVRGTPGLSGKRVGSVPAGKTLRVLQGPVCKDGMVWWRVRAEGKHALRGWTSEGKPIEGKPGKGFFLVPVQVGRAHPRPVPPQEGQPTFTREITVEPAEGTTHSFSPDGEVVSLFFSDMEVETPQKPGRPLAKAVTIELPVNSRTKEARVELYILGYIFSNKHAQGGARFLLKGVEKTEVWPKGTDRDIEATVPVKIEVVPSFTTTLTVKVKQLSAQGEAHLAIDMIELVLYPPTEARKQFHG
jgi:hypothetical protein